MRCIILDGWHKGEMFDVAEARPDVRLPRPAYTIVCECDPYQPQQEYPQESRMDTYSLAFRSLDGQVALYSLGGKSDAVWRNVGNLIRRERPVGLHTIYIDCHDERAWA